MNWKKLAWIITPLLLGSLSSIFTVDAIQHWYAGVRKPWFNPPNEVFGPVWTLLYFMMGLAVWRVAKRMHRWRRLGLTLFWVQLSLNIAWSFIFFYCESIQWAFVEIILLWLAINATILVFSRVDKYAAYLLLPYISWVSFAAILNFSLLLLNA